MNCGSLASVRVVSRRSASLIALVGAACLLVALPASSAPAAVVQCGDTLLQSTVVSNDLNCPDDGTAAADGLIIGADGIVVDLAGHTISAASPGDSTGHVGIAFNGHARVKLRNGNIKGFTEGIGVLVDGDGNVLDRISTSDNGVGVWIFQGDRNRIANSRQDRNRTGVRVEGGDAYPPPAGMGRNTIIFDRATGNGTGIALDSAGSSNSVSHSTLRDNAFAGIELLGGSGDSFTYNKLAANGFAGLSVLQSQNITISANTASNNMVGFSFRDCPDTSAMPCTSGALIRNNQALRNMYGFDAGLFFNGVFRANRAQINSAAGFRLRGTSAVSLVDNIAGSASSRSGATDGNGLGIEVGDGDDGRGAFFGSSQTVLVGNRANSNTGGPDGPGDGIIIRRSRGQVGSDATLIRNTTNRNAADGIRVEEHSVNSVTLSSNRAAYNRRYGIEVLLAFINDGGGNTAFGNLLGQCVGVECF